MAVTKTNKTCSVDKRTAKHGEGLQFLRDAVASETDECILWPFGVGSKGYGQVVYEGRNQHASRVVLILATGEDPPELHACHGPCHNPLCVNPKHLYWGTPLQNRMDRKRDGTHNTGEDHGYAALTEEQVIEIYTGNLTYPEMTTKFGVSQGNIGFIRNDTTWTHVTGNLTKSRKSKAKKLIEEDAKSIYLDSRPTGELARAYGVSTVTIKRIRNGSAWSHITKLLTKPEHRKQKLTASMVAQIYQDPRRSVEVAADYGVSRQSVADIRAGRTWKHVTGPLVHKCGITLSQS